MSDKTAIVCVVVYNYLMVISHEWPNLIGPCYDDCLDTTLVVARATTDSHLDELIINTAVSEKEEKERERDRKKRIDSKSPSICLSDDGNKKVLVSQCVPM